MKKIIIVLVLVCGFLKLNAQQHINDYKYVIVEKQFQFQTEPNQYDLNELTRFLLKKHGFRPILESDIYPDDLKSNFCLALQSEVVAKGFLNTIVTISLKDCNNNILFQAEGSTKEKSFDKLYSYAIREAFENFKALNYNYVPNSDVVNKTTIQTKEDDSVEVEKLKAEIEALKKKKETTTSKTEENPEKVLEATPKPIEKSEPEKPKTKVIYLEAKATDNGYNLVNADTKKVMHSLTKTGMDNVFIVKDANGIVYKKEGQWILEYTKGSKTVVEILNIIFQ